VSIIPPVAPLKAPAPSTEPSAEPSPGPSAAEFEAEPEAPAAPEPEEAPSIPTPTLETSMSPTLEAIERLESELRRRADEAQAAVPPPPVSPYPDEPLFPAPPTFLRPAPPEGFAPAESLSPEEGFTPAEGFAPAEGFGPPEGFTPSEGFAPPAEPAPAEPGPPERAPWDLTPVQPAPSEPIFVEPPAPEEPVLAEPPAPAPPEPAEPPPAWAPSAFGTPTPPPIDPPVAAPPPLVEPPLPPLSAPAPSVPPPSGPAFDAPPRAFEPPAFEPPAGEPTDLDVTDFDAPAFGAPPQTAAVDLPPPPGTSDLAHLPPPIGLQPAALPPYDPAADFAVPAPHPDDLGVGEALPPGPFPPPSFDLPPPTTAVPDSPETEDDDVDEVDRAFGTGAIAVDGTGAVHIIAPPSEPIPTQRLADDEHALVDEVPESHPALLIEGAGPEPTPLDLRAGRAARLFWLWFAANSSVVSLALGAVLFGLGMSLRQALVAIFVGVALSCLPLGLVTLAGKWSGQPTMVVSRATFGLVGNGLPAVLALVSRVFWGGALLWVLAAGVASVLVDAGLDAGLGELVWTLVGLGAGFALAFVVAIFGYGLIARVQLVLSILTAVLVVGVVVLTFPQLDIAAAQSIDDGPWMLLVTGVVLVFSFVGLAWVHSTADVARYQRTESDGGSTMLWAIFGATLPALILVAWGALLAASDPLIADGLATDPVYTIAALLPLWYPAPLIAALALGLLSGVVLTIYSGGFALLSLGIPARRSVTTAIAGVLVLVAAAALLFVAGDARGLILDVATTIAVPVAAWVGIFGAEVMIRRRGFDADSLLERGGVYPAVRWVNLLGLVVISAVGFGLSSATLAGLDWQGFLLPYLGLAEGDPLLTSDAGVLVALVLGLLLPLATAVPAIRRQEAADQNLRS
jgi:purine-cytosine permease-like protein